MIFRRASCSGLICKPPNFTEMIKTAKSAGTWDLNQVAQFHDVTGVKCGRPGITSLIVSSVLELILHRILLHPAP